MIIIGYSGHAFVVIDILRSMNKSVMGYCENIEKSNNPFGLTYLGSESEENCLELFKTTDYFIGIGNNNIREKIQKKLTNKYRLQAPINAIHSSSIIASSVKLRKGVMVAANATVNPLVRIGDGVILNTASIVDHECIIGNYSHICPGATLAGNVEVGNNCFIGANSVIKQGIKIGNNVTVGAGTVVIQNIPNNSRVVGNPQRFI